MSTTQQLVIYDAVVTALMVSPALAEGNIKTMRDTNRPMDADVASQIRVFLDQSLPSPIVGGGAPVDWATRIRVECLARDVLGATPVKALDAASALAANVQKRILESTALQALISAAEPGAMQWAEDEADTSLTACQCLFTLVHRTPFTNLIV